jgi:hypothetical protein
MTVDFLSHVSGYPASLFEPHSSQWIMAHALISMGRLGFQDYFTRAVASFVVPMAHSIRYATDGIHPKCLNNICLIMDPLLCQGLLEWQASLVPELVSFCLLSPALLVEPQSYKGIDNPLTHLVKTLPLHTLMQDLIHMHKKRELQTLFSTAPDSKPDCLCQHLLSIMN